MKNVTPKLDSMVSVVSVAKGESSPLGVLGIDVGDRSSRFCLVDWSSGEVLSKGRLSTTKQSVGRLVRKYERLRVAIEVGTHSGWMGREIEGVGHEVIVANSRKLRAIYESDRKNDELDALMLARLARMDPSLLSPIQHRGEEAQADLAVLRARTELVRCRTKLVNSVRGTVKAFGERLPSCSAQSFHKMAAGHLPETLRAALDPLVHQIEQLTLGIRGYDAQIAKTSERYPVVERFREDKGVGPITALTFALTLEHPKRFKSARAAGPYLGLCPRLDQSGDSSRQLRITKAGDTELRSLLVSCAQYILGPFGEDCDLRRHGLKIAERGGKNAKKRALVAVARKLAILLLALWKNNTPYEPLRQRKVH